jgi:hypothetical protein
MNLSMRMMKQLLTVDTHTASVVLGNVTAKKNGHGEISVVEHNEELTIPWSAPIEQHRGAVGNQREALRRSFKKEYFKCPNCEEKQTVYTNHSSGEMWCIVCAWRD